MPVDQHSLIAKVFDGQQMSSLAVESLMTRASLSWGLMIRLFIKQSDMTMKRLLEN
jgi:hypothetical protein